MAETGAASVFLAYGAFDMPTSPLGPAHPPLGPTSHPPLGTTPHPLTSPAQRSLTTPSLGSGSPNGEACAQLRHDGVGQLGADSLALGIEDLSLGEGTGASWPLQEVAGRPQGPDAEIHHKDAQINRLAGTLSHWRAWAAEVAARYAAYNPDVARPARRIYIGGLPQNTSDTELRQFFNELMIQTGGAAAPGFPIMSCKLYPEKNYAFVEFRTVEEASNCMALDGVQFGDSHLRIRRPNNYASHIAAVLGPQTPDPTMDLSPLNIVKTVVPDSPSKLFIGGLPCDWTEDQVKDMLQPFGELKAFNLVMDKNTGNSKGYAFAELRDVTLTDYVIQNLNGKPIGNKFMTVKRALAPPQY